jgi:hypothetical protein
VILIVDRGQTKKGIYTFEFGVEQDILIGRWEIYMNAVKPDIMSQVDELVTNSPSKVFCVTHIKHPLLMEDYSDDLNTRSGFFGAVDEISIKKKLRNYFAVRLTYRRYPVELYDFGRRLFK